MKKFYITILFFNLSLAAVFAQPTYVPTNGLISWWGFNGDFQDQSGNGNHLTAGTSAPTATTDRFGATNSAYTFNGSNNYLTNTALSSAFSQSGSFSVSIWIKKQSNVGGTIIMSGSSSSNNFVWNMQANTTFSMFGTNKQGSSWFWINGPNYTVNDWEHFVGTYSNGSMSFYKNGVLVGSNTNTHSANTSSLPIWIGRGAAGSYTNGSMDDIGLWDRVLTQTEINQLYQSALSTENFTKQNISLYPNPSSNVINVTFPIEQIGENFEIYDELGRKVHSNKVQDVNTEINISEFAKGLYFLKSNNELKTIKFIKG